MPRKRDRFNRLKQYLKDSKGSPSDGSKAKAFQNFLNGTTEYKIDPAHKPPVGAKKRGVVGLLPFNVATTDIYYAAAMTKWSHTKMADAGATGTDFGHQTWKDNDAKYQRDGAYYPAVIIAQIKEASWDNPTKKSQITQENYTRIGSRGVSVPFGKKSGTDAEDDRAKSLLGTVRSKAIGASYVPEEWRAASVGLPPIADVPAYT